MSVENILPNMGELGKEAVGQKRHCLFISAAWGTNAGLREIKDGLGKAYGHENVTVFNSVFSSDTQNTRRFEEIATVIQDNAKKGLDVVAHSLGAVELLRAINIVKKRDATFFDSAENTENLHITLVSPSGFNKGIIGAFKYLERTFRFNREQGSWPIFSKLETLHRGIDALTAFPPKDISSADLALALRNAMLELSQYREEVGAIPLEEERNNISYLSPNQKGQFDTYSEMMHIAIENKNYDELRHLIAKYGKIFFPQLNEIYAGNFKLAKDEVSDATKATMGAYIGAIRSLINSLGSTPMKEIAKLQQKGVVVDFVIPEYDIFMKLDQAIAFFDGSDEASKHVKIGVGITHQFPALQGMEFGKIASWFGHIK